MVYTSSPTLMSHLKAAAPIRLIEGDVVSPKNSGSGSPRNGRELSSESGVLRPSFGHLWAMEPVSWSRDIDEVRVIDMLDCGMSDQLGTRRWHREVLVRDLLNKGRLQAI